MFVYAEFTDVFNFTLDVSFQETLQKVEDDLALCKQASDLQQDETWMTDRSANAADKDLFGQFDNDNDNALFGSANSSRWLDESILEPNRDWSRLSLESNSSQHSSRQQQKQQQHSAANASHESMSALLHRYSQDRSSAYRSSVTSASKFNDESKDYELQDIFKDIGKLSKKLESRIRISRDTV